jgi:hypothetical protein
MQHSEPLVELELSVDGIDAIVGKEQLLEARQRLEALQLADLVELQVHNFEVDQRGKIFNARYHVIGQVELTEVDEALQGLNFMDFLLLR